MDPVQQTYQYMDERARKKVEAFTPRDPRFNPSSISKCARQLGYKHLNFQPEFEEGSGFLSQYGPSGDFYHDQVRFEMRDAGVEFHGLTFDDETRKVTEDDKCETTISHNGVAGIDLKGRGDGRIMVDGTMMYNELKSVGTGKYRWMNVAYQKGNLTSYLMTKYPEFIWQTNMMCAPEMLNLTHTYLTLINRDNCQFGCSDKNFKNRKGLVLAFDPALWEIQKNKMAMTQGLANKGELPMAAASEGSVACQRCPYEKECWS